MTTAQEQTLVNLPPDAILADDNSRFNLKKLRIDQLAASILEAGGVLTPIEVEPITPTKKGDPEYRLTAGFYRLAAVKQLNSAEGAGLSIPAIVHENTDPLARLRRQLTENMERENQSPMDKAVAIRKLLDAGVSRGDVRRIFQVARGKNLEPMSNAMMNIYLRFLELPKAIQEKIHDGRVGVEAAYELGKVSPERRQEVLERAEAERAAAIKKEEADEERYLAAEKRLQDAETKEKEAEGQLRIAQDGIVDAQKLLAEKQASLRSVQQEDFAGLDDDGKKKYMERLKSAQADLKGAEKLVKDKKNEIAKHHGMKSKAEEAADTMRKKLEEARKGVKKTAKAGRGKGESVSRKDVQKAAASTGAATGYVALNLSEIRQGCKDVASGKGYSPKVQALGKAFKDFVDGKTTPKLLAEELAVIIGEKEAAATAQSAPAPKAAPTKK